MDDGPADENLDLPGVSASRPMVAQDNFELPTAVVDTMGGCQNPLVGDERPSAEGPAPILAPQSDHERKLVPAGFAASNNPVL